MAQLQFQCPFCNRHINCRRKDAVTGFVHPECGAEIRISIDHRGTTAEVIQPPATPDSAVRLPDAKPFHVRANQQNRRIDSSGKQEVIDEDKLNISVKWRTKFLSELPWDYMPSIGNIRLERRLLILIAIVGIPGIIAISYFLLQEHESDVLLETKPEEKPTNLRSWPEAKDAVEKTIRSFVEAPSWQEKLDFICSPERVKNYVQDYYENQKPPPIEIRSFRKVLPLMLGETPFYLVEFEDEDYLTHSVDVYEIDREYKLNWESMVAYGSIPWSTFCEDRPTSLQDLRVYVMPIDFYEFEFSDRKRYDCYRITHRSGAPALYGYVERGTLSGLALRLACSHSRTQPVYVSLQFPEVSTRDDCVIIASLIHNKWVMPKQLFQKESHSE
ncbi:MAG: hypothetical protein KDN22_24500 [Verrucomicrobiae bacterium]|nr:hypothetical protein [Verrucomicrobiae bacterium]